MRPDAACRRSSRDVATVGAAMHRGVAPARIPVHDMRVPAPVVVVSIVVRAVVVVRPVIHVRPMRTVEAADEEVVASGVFPPRLDKDVARQRLYIVTADPEVAVAVPPPVAVDPDRSGVRGGWTLFDDGGGRPLDDHHGGLGLVDDDGVALVRFDNDVAVLIDNFVGVLVVGVVGVGVVVIRLVDDLVVGIDDDVIVGRLIDHGVVLRACALGENAGHQQGEEQ